MKLKNQNSLIIAIALLLIAFTSACKKTAGTDNANPLVVTGVQLTANAKFGNILTDNNGKTLYSFSMDVSGASSCNDGCALTWLPFYKDTPVLGTGIDPADFSTITRADGSKQNTYKGWPIYYYKADVKAGDVNGDGINNFWFVAKPDYSVMLANAQLVGRDGVQYTSLSKPGQEVSQYLTDAYGRTLYAYAPDKFKKNNYTKPDFSNDAIWPVYTVTALQSVPSILDKTQFDMITVFGKTQLVYKGWPLYYFGTDAGVRGSTKGVSVPAPGVWPIVNSNSTVAPVL
jgi:predicted lipoprotein with Yx(FWY)xxD motif